MTTTRDDLITTITEQLGNVATRDDGEQVRAAYWLSADKQADVRLTDRTQADLPDDQLLAAAMATAAEVGLEIGDGSIEIGDFTE